MGAQRRHVVGCTPRRWVCGEGVAEEHVTQEEGSLRMELRRGQEHQLHEINSTEFPRALGSRSYILICSICYLSEGDNEEEQADSGSYGTLAAHRELVERNTPLGSGFSGAG